MRSSRSCNPNSGVPQKETSIINRGCRREMLKQSMVLAEITELVLIKLWKMYEIDGKETIDGYDSDRSNRSRGSGSRCTRNRDIPQKENSIINCGCRSEMLKQSMVLAEITELVTYKTLQDVRD